MITRRSLIAAVLAVPFVARRARPCGHVWVRIPGAYVEQCSRCLRARDPIDHHEIKGIDSRAEFTVRNVRVILGAEHAWYNAG